MRTIPNVLLSTPSSAERKVFDLLKDVDLGELWTAYHSLNCSEHAYKHWAEIDFLLVGPEALLVLEVKGGRVSCTDGLWTFTDRFHRSRTSSEGPYGQARSAMYALRKLLAERYHLRAISEGRVPFGFGVLFPDIDWDVDTPECPAAVTADLSMLVTANSTTRYLKRLSSYWREKTTSPSRLNIDDIRELRNKLRPDVDVYPPLSQRIGVVLTEMQHLTEEQYERLEILEQNDRAIVSGGAGTGKTFLLIQYARRCAAGGATVLVVVFSPTLAEHLRRTVHDPKVRISAYGDLSRFARDSIDVLLVDEGQDLTNMDALAELSSRLKGGLDGGRWGWFLDENNQAGLVGRFESDALAYLQSGIGGHPPIRLPLRRNCRNTKEIVRQVQLWTGADIGRTELTGFGQPPQLVIVSDSEECSKALAKLLRDVLDHGAEAAEIGIVTPTNEEPSAFSSLPAALRRMLTPLDTSTVATDLRARILWGPASQFKGLERPVVIVLAAADFTLAEQGAALYVAMTRANYGLWILASSQLAAELVAAQARHGTELLGDR